MTRDGGGAGEESKTPISAIPKEEFILILEAILQNDFISLSDCSSFLF